MAPGAAAPAATLAPVPGPAATATPTDSSSAAVPSPGGLLTSPPKVQRAAQYYLDAARFGASEYALSLAEQVHTGSETANRMKRVAMAKEVQFQHMQGMAALDTLREASRELEELEL